MILFLNPTCGLSGDMLLAALVDLGAPLDPIRAAITATGLTGWQLDVQSVHRNGIAARQAVVTVEPQPTHRNASELIALATRAEPAPVAERAVRALRELAATEGHIHGIDPAAVHLHELGGHDTVVDIVGVSAAVHSLGVTEVHSAPVGLGTGTVRTRHGILPVPAPATAALLQGARVRGTDIDAETVTPTGAVLLRALDTRYTPMPESTVTRIGYGAGTRELPDRPNVLQAVLAEPVGRETPTTMVMIETTVDDVTGEAMGHAIDVLLEAGAADVWITPAMMKKNRPGHVVHVLCPTHLAPELGALLLRSTGSLGLRRTTIDRLALPRTTTTVVVQGHLVRLKQGPWTTKPEHDDVVALSAALGVSYQEARTQILAQLSSRRSG